MTYRDEDYASGLGNRIIEGAEDYASGLEGITYDADAQAFFTAAGITDGAQKDAVNDLTIALKDFGIWTKCLGIYPFVGGSAATHKFNLKDPRDLDAAYRLGFSGGLTHSATGTLPNGSTGYANTFIVPSTAMTNNDTHWSFYSRTDTITGGGVDIGAQAPAGAAFPQFFIRTSAAGGSDVLADSYTGGSRIVAANPNAQGFYIDSVASGVSHKVFKNGAQLGSTATGSGDVTLVVVGLTIFAQNINGSIGAFSNRECAFASIGQGLSDAECANFNTAVQAFNTALSRAVI